MPQAAKHPKTRLLAGDREAIRRAVIDHKFLPLEEAAHKAEAALAVETYQRAYGIPVPYLAKAPEGAFADVRRIRANVGGRAIWLRFSANDDTTRRVFFKHRDLCSDIIALHADDELGQRIVAHAQSKDQIAKDRAALEKIVTTTLEQFRSFDDLLVGWPEAESFIKARWQTRPDYSANVPAVVIKDLSAQLDLPPETREAA